MSTKQRTLSLLRARSPLASPAAQRERIDAVQLDHEHGGDFARQLTHAGTPALQSTGIDVLQVNLGKRCNQTCAHCHVDAGPDRTESMDRATVEACLGVLEAHDIPVLDITGGAPELHPEFRYIAERGRALGRHVIDRCNLTLLTATGGEELADFLAANEIEVVASLPHYRAVSTDRQRGDGVFEASIRALQMLNARGYGREPSRRLVLVTNPVGAFLPAGQGSLEAEWKRELGRLHGVEFDALFTITNMPIARYLQWLDGSGKLESYLQRLVDAFNPGAVNGLMCRTTLSVAWDGRLFDCDFNQMLEVGLEAGVPQHIRDFDLRRLAQRRVAVGRHCFGCTAGSGSSCGGALVEG
jgi:radical SAM/Cys-rich protein